MPPSFLSRLPSFSGILFLSALLRVALILYSEWHDQHSIVKYTDVDYRVFSDAAHFLLTPGDGNRAKGPLNAILEKLGLSWRLDVGDPYTRATYRYTPLLALALTPNSLLHPSFGKYLFALCDLLAGALMYRLLLSDILPHAPRKGKKERKENKSSKSENKDTRLTALATLYVSLHLLNPLVFTISTRGSSEAVLSLIVLGALYAARRERWAYAAVLLGLGTHWKIYPVVYGVGCLRAVGALRQGSEKKGAHPGNGAGTDEMKGWVRELVNAKTVRFGLVAAATYAFLSGVCYLIWGYPFLYESYIYHLHRLDHRHNFSPYFYLTYLTYPSPFGGAGSGTGMSAWSRLARSPLVSFVPQMALALGTGLLFGRRSSDLVFTWFVQTAVFVLFNKVCTSQYFLWYLLFLPLLIPRLETTPRRGIVYAVVWAGVQGLWLAEAYKLEFLGQNVFLGVWVRGCIYVVGNAWVLSEIMGDYM